MNARIGSDKNNAERDRDDERFNDSRSTKKDNTTYYSDGSSKEDASGPCGPRYFDENGEEC